MKEPPLSLFGTLLLLVVGRRSSGSSLVRDPAFLLKDMRRGRNGLEARFVYFRENPFLIYFYLLYFIVLIIFTLSIRPGILLGIPETFGPSEDGLLQGVDAAKEPSTSLQ